MIIGLTGGIATGKSTVAKMFKELGAHVIDYDQLAREVVEPKKRAWRKIVEYFGEQILNKDFTINRQQLGDLVFSAPEKLKKLNQIIHPEVFRQAENMTKEILKHNPRALIIKDIPLLIETGAQKTVEKIIVVHCDMQTQMHRMLDRGYNQEKAWARINAHAPAEEKLKYADYVIYNNGTAEETKKQVALVHEKLLRGR